MKYRLIVFFSIILLIISCSLPGDPAEEIILEDYTISITFDREKYEFGDLSIRSELDPVNFPESILIDPITSTSHIDFDSLYVGDVRDSVLLRINSEISIPAGTPVPSYSTQDSIVNIPDDSELNWAVIRDGSVDVNVQNRYSELGFSSINIHVMRRDDPYGPDPSFQSPDGEVMLTDRTVIDTTVTELDAGTDRMLHIDLENKWITNGMKVIVTAENGALDGGSNSGIDDSQYLGFDIMLNKCRFDSVSADFRRQTAEEKDYYSTDIEKVKLRYIVGKNVELSAVAENNTDFVMNVWGQIDSLYDLRNNNAALVLDPVEIQPRSTYNIDPVNIDSCKLVADFETQSTEIITYSNCFSPDTVNNRFVKFRRYLDNAVFNFKARGTQDDPRVGFYEFDGIIENDTIELPEYAVEIGDDLDWDELSGVELDSITVKLAVGFPREDLNFKELSIRNFELKGKKTDGTESAWHSLNDIDFKYNFNKDTVLLKGLEPVLNFKPDSLVYKADLILGYDGKIFDTDRMEMEMSLEVPMTFTLTDSIIRKNDIENIEALIEDDETVKQIKSLKMNAFINNPVENAKVLFNVKLSETADLVNGELTGNVKDAVKVWLVPNPDGTGGYMLDDIAENQDLGITSEGISLSPEIIDMMLYSDTFMQSSVKAYPQEGTSGTVTLEGDEFVEVQIKFTADLVLGTGGGE